MIKVYELNKNQVADKVHINEYGFIICPECHAIAFDRNDAPVWMTSGYCFRCGQKLDWSEEEMDKVKSKSDSPENIDGYGDKVHDGTCLDLIENLLSKVQKTVNELAEAIELASKGEYCSEDNSVESVNKYRWHDLRKNPNDLPEIDPKYNSVSFKFSENVLVITSKSDDPMVAYMDFYNNNSWYLVKPNENCEYDEYVEYIDSVIMWKYIKMPETIDEVENNND